MKKETIFRYELNESIQADAAMNCLKNRNNKQVVANQEQEEDYTNDEIPSPNFSHRMSFMVWAMREIIPYLKEISQVCAQADPTELKHAVMKILKTRDTGIPETHRSCQEWAKENYDWVEMELNGEYDAYQKKWSKPFNIPSEQEEDYGMNDLRKWRDSLDLSNNDDEETYTAYDDTDGIWMIINLMRKQGMLRAQGIEGRDDVDDGHAIDAAYDLIEQKLNDEGMWIGDDDHEAERFVSFFGEEIAAEAMKSAIHNQQSQEQEENSLDTEYFSDLEEQEAYYENFRAIAELVADQIDKENGKDVDNNMDTLFEIIREIWDNNSDDLYIWDFDEVQEKDCYKFFDKYYETIKNEYLKREHNNIMDALHGDLFASEQEEMEVTDAKHALAQLAADLLHYDDGDLDELYYAISDIIDSEGYCPQTDEYEMWIEEHVNEIEDLIM